MVKIFKIKRSSFQRVLPLLALFIFCSLNDSITVQAQQTRIAYIDASKLLKRMPEATDAQLRLDQLSATWAKEANDMQSEITRKQAEYDRRKLIMTDAERSASEVDLQNLRKKLDDYRHQKFDENTGELWTQYAQLMKPAYDRLENAIKDVALDAKFDYVLDRSAKDVTLLYTNSKFDLTIPVARKLGIESEILTTPLVNNGPKSGMKPNQVGMPGANPGAPGANPGMPGANPGAPGNNPLPNPGGQGLTPNNGTSTQPGSPGYNSGGYNPDQIPPVVTKKP